MDWRVRSVTQLLVLGFLFAVVECGTGEQRVVCYYTNWSVYRPGTAKFSPQNINPYLCTHLIYAFGGFTKENTLKPFDKYQDIEKGGYAKFTGLKTYNKNLKTMLAVGGWNEGSTRFSPMVADPERRKQFVRNTVKFLRQNHFDGLDLDWEYPAFRDGGKPRDRDNYASLVQELREAYERESSKTGRPRLLLSMAVPAGIEYINKGYDIPKLNKYLDFINLLSYDYHSSYEPAVNHHSPLYPLEEDNEYNFDTELTVDYTIKHLLDSGASADKIVLGIPTYGRSYTLFNEDATDIGSPADGPGEEGDATREKGYLAYYEICEALIQSEDWEVVSPNPNAMGPYAYKGNQWVGYDDEAIVRLKAQYVTENGLGGIMFWSIDNDDFRGKCHDRPYPLIEAAKEAMLAGSEKTGVAVKSTRPSKTPTDSNFIGRKLGAGRRRTTEAPAIARKESSRKRVNSLRSRNRSNNRDNLEEEEVQVQINGRNRGQFFGSEEEEDLSHNSNAVRSIASGEEQEEETPQRSQSGKQARRRRPENSRRRSTTEASISEPSAAQAGNHRITTPAPPTTPDPGTDFKCEDEGFFSHPRDCKKYFWCLDAGPGGLGIVAHHFTCPAGLVFNKAADSCDYPRNVVCPKTKPDEGPTTRAPIIAATSRTTRIHSTTRRSSTSTTTEPSDISEEYEYYDDEDEEEEVVPTTTTTARTLQYKTISRNRPTTTTSTAAPSTSTEIPKTATSRSYQTIPSRSSSIAALASIEESEEDPKVIQELIELIKKAGGIEELEKQLHLQGKSSESSGQSSSATNKADVTPATISRSLYERVLNRQAANGGTTLFRRTTIPPTTTVTTEIPEKLDPQESVPQRSKPSFRNGPGQAQFEGLDDIPEVKSLRRERPQYVTINRQRPSTEAPNETSEEVAEDNSDVASSDQTSLTDPPEERPSTQRESHGYVDIRRSRTSTARSNQLEDEDESNVRQQRRRPTTSETETEDEDKDEDVSNDAPSSTEAIVARRRNQFAVQEEASGTTSRYQTIHRVRSTTQAAEETSSEEDAKVIETTTVKSSNSLPADVITTESPVERIDDKLSTSETTSAIEQSVLQTTTPVPESPLTTETQNLVPTDLPVQISDPSTTLLPSVTAKTVEEPTTVASSSPETITRGSTTGPQQRPFGFQRRTRPTTTATTEIPETTSSVSSDTGRVKVLRPETVRLPTLKELIGHNTIVAHDHTSTTPITLSIKILLDEKAVNPSEHNKYNSKTVTPIFEREKVERTKDMGIKNEDISVGEEYPLNKYTTSETARNNKHTNDVDENSVLHLVESSTESSPPSTLPIRILKQDKIESRRRRVKLVNIPVRILESDIPVTDVILQVPEYKLNSVLRSLLRVEIINNENNTTESSNESKNVNIHSQRTTYNVEHQNYGKDNDIKTENEFNELLNKDANTNPILSDNQFTSTTPIISTLRGSTLVIPRQSRNRGFYVTKNIESSTLTSEDVTLPITVQTTELDNEITQQLSTTTDQLSTSNNEPLVGGVTTTESYYTTQEEFSTTTEQLSTVSDENLSTITDDNVSTTVSDYQNIMQEAFGAEKSWPSIISTSLENFNNILANNDDVDRAEMPREITTVRVDDTSTEYSLSTTEESSNVRTTESNENLYLTDSGETLESYFTKESESSTESSTSSSDQRESKTTSGTIINTITDNPEYYTSTPDIRQTTINQNEYSTTESSVFGFEARSTLGEESNSNIETSTEPDIETTTVSDFDGITSTSDHETTVITSTESTGFNTEVNPYSESNSTESTSDLNTPNEFTTESESDYTSTTTFVTDNPIDDYSASQTMTTDFAGTVPSNSDFDVQTTPISSIDPETTTAADFTTASSISTDSILSDSITTHGLFTTTPDETTTDSFTTSKSVATASEVETTTVNDGESTTSTILPITTYADVESASQVVQQLDATTVSSLITSESESTSPEKKEEPMNETQEVPAQAPRLFVPIHSNDSEFSSRGFYRSPTAIPGKKTVRRRIIKKRIYGVRRPHVEAIGENETAGDFAALDLIEKLNRMKNGRRRYIRRRIINHSTGKVVLDEIIKRSSTAVSGNQTIAIIDTNPEIVKKVDEPSLESKNTLVKKLLRHRTTYRRQPLKKNQTNSSINANISSQNNSASNDVQSTSVSSTISNQRRRIIVQRFRYRSSTTSPSPSPSSKSPLVEDVLGQLNSTKIISIKVDDDLLKEDKNKTNGQDNTDVTIDNLSSGSESYGRVSVYGREEIPRTESISEALGTEDEQANEGEINLFKTRVNNQRRPGTLVRQSRPSTTTSVPDDEIVPTTSPSTKAPSRVPIRRRFRLGQRQATTSTNAVAQNQAPQEDRETVKSETNDADSENLDQIGHAQESEVTVAVQNPTTQVPGVSKGRPSFRTSIRRRIITTEAPQLTTVSTTTPRHQTIVRQRQRPNPFDKIQENQPTRPRHPAIIDYDYYGDEEESIVGRSRLSGKLSFTANGSFRCLDQGNFPHPTSCKKFITCARMVDGQIVGTEYTCPKKLSYDPVGGICNWSAGLGCKEI